MPLPQRWGRSAAKNCAEDVVDPGLPSGKGVAFLTHTHVNVCENSLFLIRLIDAMRLLV
jgi:hypothetical protein